MKQPRIPAQTLLETGTLPIEELALLALREGQSTSPLFRVHRWFARRLSVQFRSLLAAISLHRAGERRFWDRFYGDIDLSGLVTLDPFVGGGTSLIEAANCGADVVGYDIDPVAASIARFGLDIGSYDDIPLGVRGVEDDVAERIKPYHLTKDNTGRCVEVLHHFWVEGRTCPSCGAEFDLHPHHQLAYDPAKGLQWAFCRSCDLVHEIPIPRKQVRCGCGERTTIHSGALLNGYVHCPQCGHAEELSARGRRTGEPPRWRLFAQEYIEGEGRKVVRRFKAAGEEDRCLFDAAALSLELLERNGHGLAPERPIPQEGRSDGRPLIHGFRRYRELFNARQLLHLTVLGRAVASVEDPRKRLLLGIAFSDHLTSNCMYAAYAFGYRRISPLFSIHGYRHISRPVELNPWLDGIGRGTYPNALNKIRRAIEFSKAPTYLGRDCGRDWSAVRSRLAAPPGGAPTPRATIRTSSSADLSALADESVDLILTDPPYFDNLSYSELSDFYLCWHQVIGIAEPPYDDPARHAPIRDNLAITDRSDLSVEGYARTLSEILRECQRVLTLKGLCVFTYHHTALRAWYALAHALANSGLRTTSVVPSRGEGQGGLHSYEGTIKWDAVLVCRKGSEMVAEDKRPLVVRVGEVRRAADLVASYAERLSRPAKIGFRSPDRLNLFRAIVVSHSQFGSHSKGFVLLEDALQREPTE